MIIPWNKMKAAMAFNVFLTVVRNSWFKKFFIHGVGIEKLIIHGVGINVIFRNSCRMKNQ